MTIGSQMLEFDRGGVPPYKIGSQYTPYKLRLRFITILAMLHSVVGILLCPYFVIECSFNPVQAGVFWNHIGWGVHCAPLRFSFICCPITTKLGMLVLWHKISQNSTRQIHSDVTMTSMTSSLLCRVSKTAKNSLCLNRCCFFIFYPTLFKLGSNI